MYYAWLENPAKPHGYCVSANLSCGIWILNFKVQIAVLLTLFPLLFLPEFSRHILSCLIGTFSCLFLPPVSSENPSRNPARIYSRTYSRTFPEWHPFWLSDSYLPLIIYTHLYIFPFFPFFFFPFRNRFLKIPILCKHPSGKRTGTYIRLNFSTIFHK